MKDIDNERYLISDAAEVFLSELRYGRGSDRDTLKFCSIADRVIAWQHAKLVCLPALHLASVKAEIANASTYNAALQTFVTGVAQTAAESSVGKQSETCSSLETAQYANVHFRIGLHPLDAEGEFPTVRFVYMIRAPDFAGHHGSRALTGLSLMCLVSPRCCLQNNIP